MLQQIKYQILITKMQGEQLPKTRSHQGTVENFKAQITIRPTEAHIHARINRMLDGIQQEIKKELLRMEIKHKKFLEEHQIDQKKKQEVFQAKLFALRSINNSNHSQKQQSISTQVKQAKSEALKIHNDQNIETNVKQSAKKMTQNQQIEIFSKVIKFSTKLALKLIGPFLQSKKLIVGNQNKVKDYKSEQKRQLQVLEEEKQLIIQENLSQRSCKSQAKFVDNEKKKGE